MIPKPDIKCKKLSSKDKFLVVACDGIWEMKSDQDIVDFIEHHLPYDPNPIDLQKAISKLLDHIVARDTMSNDF